MQFEFIDENLFRILNDPDNVMYLKPGDVGGKRALFAVVKEGEGIYRKLQITKEQSKLNFPFEPIYVFYRGPGYVLLKNFISIHNITALNVTNLEGFKEKKLNARVYNTGVFAVFNDGSATFAFRDKEKRLHKKGASNSFSEILNQYKDVNLSRDEYCVIEEYPTGDGTFVIPELQKNAGDGQNNKVFVKTEDN